MRGAPVFFLFKLVENSMPNTVPRRPIRWWPLGIILALGIGIVGVVQSNDSMPFQRRNLISIPIGMGTFLLTWIWWGFFSRAAGKLRVISSLLLILAGIACFSLFRVVGVTGDLVPVFVFRWRSTPAPVAAAKGLEQRKASPDGEEPRDSYAQFLGPNRDGRLPGPLLATNWNDVPPRVIWRRPVGTGWAGFAVAGRRAVTLEQDGPAEVIGCYDADTGEPLWRQAYEARYSTPIGGEGPRTTPTIVSNRVYTFGATGWLKCLDLASGSNYWSVDVPAAGGRALEWGMAGSPLVWKGLVIVPAGVTPNQRVKPGTAWCSSMPRPSTMTPPRRSAWTIRSVLSGT